MRLLVVELLFIASSLPLWRHEFDLSTVIDVDSYVVLAAAFWTIVFTADITRVWLKSRPKKQQIKGFEAAEPGVPHGRFIRTSDTSFTVFLRTAESPWKGLGPICAIAIAVPVLLYIVHMLGLMAESTVMLVTIEVLVCFYALFYLHLASAPTKIEVDESAIVIDGKRLHRSSEGFERFLAGPRLSYVYGGRTHAFGGFWKEPEANDIVKALTALTKNQPKKPAESLPDENPWT